MNQTFNHLLAQAPVASGLGKIGNGSCEGLGPFCSFLRPEDAVVAIANILSTIIGLITTIAGLYFIFQFMIGGFEWMTSSGDKTRLQKAQERMTHSLIGLIIVVASFALISIIARILGFQSFFLNNPGQLINQLKLGGGTTP